MAFFSYAPSFEDVLLHRAFSEIEKGFYVEVGAGHPCEGSPTYALYLAGWRGITIEPRSEVADLFVKLRPEDRHLLVLAGPEHLNDQAFHAWQGVGPRPASASTTRNCVTLNEVLDGTQSQDIHLLVLRPRRVLGILAGLDLAKFRPWMVLVGDLADEDVGQVEELMGKARYRKAHFDGLNRFFLAEEHDARLAPSFALPVNAHDKVVTVRGGEHDALAKALLERDELARQMNRAENLRRLAQEKARIALGLRPNWPRQIDLPIKPIKGLQIMERPAGSGTTGHDLAITITGHINGSYSLASVNRSYAEALARFSKASVHLAPIEGGEPRKVERVDGPDRALFESLAETPPRRAKLNVAISQHYPPFVPEGDYDLKLMVFFWEESIVPSRLVALINEGFDAVLVATRFVAKALIDSGVTIPVRVVRHPRQFEAFEALRAERMERGAKPLEEELIFLHVSSCFPRKGVDRLVEAYLEAFSADDPVRLIIKGFPNPHNEVAGIIARMRECHPNRAPITFINEELSEERLLSLYRRADVLVLPTRGEGLNLPAAEGLMSGLPLIVTAFGGHVDFCASDVASLVDFSFAPSQSHLATPGSVWADPEGDDLKAAFIEMRQRLKSRPFVPVTDDVEAFFDRRRFAARIEKVIEEISSRWWETGEPLKVAWISTYEVRCGIAEYSRHLVSALSIHGLKVTVLADRRTPADLPTPPELDALYPIWDPHKIEAIDASVEVLAGIAPDVVVLQYHPAYFAWRTIERLVQEALTQKAIVIITLHNVRWLSHQGLHERHQARTALEKVDRIVVHTVLDLNFLKQLGFVDNVVLMPQGVALLEHLPADRGTVITSSPLIGCYGFFLPHKGIRALIEAFDQVRRVYPGARLRLVNAEYPALISAAEIRRCRELVERLGLTDAVEWHTQFLPHEDSIVLLADCDIVVLPYEDTNEASSAAARGALSSRRPVAVTPIQIFEELGEAGYRLPGTDSRSIARGLLEFLNDDTLRRSTLAAAISWLERCDWKAVAQRFYAMVQGLQKAEHRRDKGQN